MQRTLARVALALAACLGAGCDLWIRPPGVAMGDASVAIAPTGGVGGMSGGSVTAGTSGAGAAQPATGAAGWRATTPATRADAGVTTPAVSSDEDGGVVDPGVPATDPAQPGAETPQVPTDPGTLNPGDLQCPNEVCIALPPPPPEAMGMFSIELCCADSGDCGTAINGEACIFTPDNHPDCPLIRIMEYDIPNCCTPDGRCGLDGAAFMRECTSLEDVASMAMGFIEVPAPAPCTPL